MTVKIVDEETKYRIIDDWIREEVSQRELARRYGVSARTIGRIIKERTVEKGVLGVDDVEFEQQVKDAVPVGDDEWEETAHEMEDFYFIINPESLTIIKGTQSFSKARGDYFYDEIVKELISGNYDKALELVNVKDKVLEYTHGKLSIIGDDLYYMGTKLSYTVVDRVIESVMGAVNEGSYKLADRLMKFFERLFMNPSEQSIEALYTFLENSDIEIDDDGYLQAYKGIREDWTDIYSGTFSNMVGQIPEMPRTLVDSDNSQSCSKGLHVCSYKYIMNGGFVKDGHRIVRVKVDPADVVSVPVYDNTKLRCCRYEVVEYLGFKEDLEIGY